MFSYDFFFTEETEKLIFGKVKKTRKARLRKHVRVLADSTFARKETQ